MGFVVNKWNWGRIFTLAIAGPPTLGTLICHPGLVLLAYLGLHY
jgi:hypothetical protein